MTEFEMHIEGNEHRVYTLNSKNNFGQKEVGPHCVVFSGSAQLSQDDYFQLAHIADDAGDDELVNFDVRLEVGPTWRDVKQCSPMVAPRAYVNDNADEDDQQKWYISPCSWEVVETSGGKKIRLRFAMNQLGENTKFHGITYQITATGYALALGI